MPPHLHPRSTATSTLFAGTLLASFIVVGIPHVFPCPRPRKGYADSENRLDSEGKSLRRKGRKIDTVDRLQDKMELGSDRMEEAGKDAALVEEAAVFRLLQEEADELDKEARECPVPKPTGLLGKLLGIQEAKSLSKQQEKPSTA